jgi:proline iminopeptidase
VVLLDQRGAGKSTPVAEIRENTTQLLVQDIETLRRHLGIPKWHMVFGGSWGSTLALAYAESHPEMVGSLVLRGVFFGRDASVVEEFFPEAHEELLEYLPSNQRGQYMQAYLKMLTEGPKEKQLEAAKVWNRYEMNASSLFLAEDAFKKLDDEDWCLAHARLECHYISQGCFLEDGQLLKEENIAKLRNIPSMYVTHEFGGESQGTDIG